MKCNIFQGPEIHLKDQGHKWGKKESLFFNKGILLLKNLNTVILILTHTELVIQEAQDEEYISHKAIFKGMYTLKTDFYAQPKEQI